MPLTIDTDAILWSAPENERANRPLLVLLHGYGSHEGDLFGLSPQLPLEPVIASVRAPIAESGGFAWFSRIGQIPGDPTLESVNEAARAIIDWLDTIEYVSVSLLGFSQGAAMSLQLLRLAPKRFTSAVALSGFVAGGSVDGDAELAELKPPVFWGRGTADTMIGDAAIDRTAAWLPSHSTLTTRVYEGLGHSISREELDDFTAFMREHAA